MKKELSPAVIVAAIACAVVLLAFGIWRTTMSRPSYPGLNAPQPGGKVTPRGIPGAPPGTTMGSPSPGAQAPGAAGAQAPTGR